MVNQPFTTPRRSPLFGLLLAWHRLAVLNEAELIAAADPWNKQAQARLAYRRQRYESLPEADRRRVERWAQR